MVDIINSFSNKEGRVNFSTLPRLSKNSKLFVENLIVLYYYETISTDIVTTPSAIANDICGFPATFQPSL